MSVIDQVQLGHDYLLFVDVNTTGTGPEQWKVILCQKDTTINKPYDAIDVSSKCGNGSLTQRGNQTVEVNALFLQPDATNNTNLDSFDLDVIAESLKSRKFKLAPSTATAADDGKIIYTFMGKINNETIAFPDKEASTVAFGISVDGKIDQTKFVFED